MVLIEKGKILEAIKMSEGRIAPAALSLGISRKTLYNRINKYPDLKADILKIRERHIDIVESQLIRNIRNGNQRAIEYYLNNMGKSRGYGFHNSYPVSRNKNARLASEKSDEQLRQETEKRIKLLCGNK